MECRIQVRINGYHWVCHDLPGIAGGPGGPGGPGIPKGKLDAIFDRFYSERPSTEKFGLHSGLGLSICKQITEAHNGDITAENRLDHQNITRGARFIITLPRVTEKQILEP